MKIFLTERLCLAFVLSIMASSVFALTHDPGLQANSATVNTSCGTAMRGGFTLEGDGAQHGLYYSIVGNCRSLWNSVVISGVISGVSQFENLHFSTGNPLVVERDEDTIRFEGRSPGDFGFFRISFVDRGNPANFGRVSFFMMPIPLPAGISTLGGSLAFLGLWGRRRRKCDGIGKFGKGTFV